jgi:sarcosine oxidase subunit delta
MKVMRCPLSGERNISEFTCFGEVTEAPAPDGASDAAWSAYLWNSNNTAGMVREWWCHVPTSYWFIAERNTVTDEILRTYAAADVFAGGEDT